MSVGIRKIVNNVGLLSRIKITNFNKYYNIIKQCIFNRNILIQLIVS